jgi:hypothetical protein
VLRNVATGWHKRCCAALLGAMTLVSLSLSGPAITPVAAQQPKPNIVFIMGDDIGWMQVGTTIDVSGARRRVLRRYERQFLYARFLQREKL